MSKKLVIMVALAIVLGVGFLFERSQNKPDPQKNKITDFAECVAAGNAVLESYPRQCRTEYGQSFTEDIGNELLKRDLIRLDNPRPGQPTENPVHLIGEARGYWYFEADFPVKVYDSNDNLLGVGVATAQEDWMSEDFVPFRSQIGYNTPQTETGYIILEKDNPSGLPENGDFLKVPIQFLEFEN